MQRLDAARRDLYRLLDFVTEHGRQVNDGLIREAVATARVNPREMTEEQEECLWRIRSTLSELVQPAHVSGLRLIDLLESETPEQGDPSTLRGWSGRWLLVAIVAVAMTHAYAVVGGRMIGDAGNNLNEALGLHRLFDGDQGGAPMPQLPGPAALPGAGVTLPVKKLTPREIQAKIDDKRLALEAYRGHLNAWNAVWRVGIFPLTARWTSVSSAAPPDGSSPMPRVKVSKVLEVRRRLRDLIEKVAVPLEAERYPADVAHKTIMEYLLPMLYGALGAFVFVVRRVTDDMDRGSLKMLLRIRYRIRLLLGAVFGLTIAMLAKEQYPLIKDIPVSAVGLAFLAGYGIDGAFGLLDTIIDRIRAIAVGDLDARPRVGTATAHPRPH